MSLLWKESKEVADDAALGEEFTKGSSHVVWATIIATILVTVAIAIYVIAGQKPPAVTGEIVTVWAHPRHSETSGVDANGEAMAKESYDQVLVFVQVRMHNQSKAPLYLLNVMANAALDNGIYTSYAASRADYDRVFLAYPGLPVPHGPAFPIDLTLDPGQTVEGTFVSSFSLTKQQWDARKDLNFTFSFRYQPKLVLAPRTAVIEQ